MKNYQLSEELVRQQLSLILEFEEIKNSQVLSRFIEFVVDKKLSGQLDDTCPGLCRVMCQHEIDSHLSYCQPPIHTLEESVYLHSIHVSPA